MSRDIAKPVATVSATSLRRALARVSDVVPSATAANATILGRVRVRVVEGLTPDLGIVHIDAANDEMAMTVAVGRAPGIDGGGSDLYAVHGSAEWILPFGPLQAAAKIAGDGVLHFTEAAGGKRVRLTSENTMPAIDSTLHVVTSAQWPTFRAAWGDEAHHVEGNNLAEAIRQVAWAAKRGVSGGSGYVPAVGVFSVPAGEGAYTTAAAIGRMGAAFARFRTTSDPCRFPALAISPAAAALAAECVDPAVGRRDAVVPVWTSRNCVQFCGPDVPGEGGAELTIRRLDGGRAKIKPMPEVDRYSPIYVPIEELRQGLAYLASYLDFGNPDYSLLRLSFQSSEVVISASNPATGSCEFAVRSDRGRRADPMPPNPVYIDPREVMAAAKAYSMAREVIAVAAPLNDRHPLLLESMDGEVQYYFAASYKIAAEPKRSYEEGVI